MRHRRERTARSSDNADTCQNSRRGTAAARRKPQALAWGRHVDDHRDAWEIVRRADHPNIGLILDSYHTLARGIDPETIRRIPGEKIFFVQLADAPAIRMDLLYLSRHFRCMPGEGKLDVTAFMRAVQATGYDGPLSLEVFNDQFRAGLPRLVALDGHRSLINLMDAVRRAEPALAVDLPEIPTPAAVEKVAFIELVAAPAEAAQLEALLQTLGFRLTGEHVSKAVRRFQQNGVNILVNTEQQGYAHAAFLSHGTCVSEIAVVVPDARQTFARGKALLAEPFGDSPNPGELDIPALRGVGGSLLRLLDAHSDLARLWDVDFKAAGQADSGTGLTAIDHILQTMPFDEMLSWTQFYTAIFEGRKAPMIDVADPEGLVRSQAVKSGALRVTLNGAEARRTLATRFLADSFGAATQHIAFACDDIFATAQALSENSFTVLPIGANYYDDLDARYDLPPDLLARLKAHNILFDQDAAGQFFQLDSRPFGDGLFFEIVQRTDHYDGYGAPNAPLRIAAQARLGQPVTIPKR
ncbi:sugar phosphate isomerase/epimerase and 4-hydroxyphenylpyruvate domain-containing protein [Seohaeicola saemankumensis]|nr:sugar phosphate isomerase/epimerase and 4-hydroxyphenylpyruvate domain-containing protein [Seohaeicola saemankumensis]